MQLTSTPAIDAFDETRMEALRSAPWHLLSVGGLAVLWNVLCFAHFGITGTASDVVNFWTQAYLGAALWGGFGGGVLLLIRSRWAVQAFTTALVGMMAASANLFVLAQHPANLYAMPMMVGLWVITLAMLFYASRIHMRGLLR